jgi:hypothetical protein
MAAGLVDRVQLTLFPVITGQTGEDPIFQGAADFDLELIESRTLDGRMQELIYQPTCTSELIHAPTRRSAWPLRWRPSSSQDGAPPTSR